MSNEQTNKAKEKLMREIQALWADYQAPGVTNERRVQIEATIEYKNDRLAELMAEERQQNPRLRQIDWQANLHRLDCRKARKEIEQIKKSLGGDSGAASFFIQNSDEMEGGHCVTHIKDAFEYERRDRLDLRHEFNAAMAMTPERMLTEFKRRLGIEELHEQWQDALRSVAVKVGERLSHGTLVFVEVGFGHIAAQDERCLHWLLDEFWPALLESVAGKGSRIHCLLVIISGKTLFKKSQLETMVRQRHTHEKCCLREIKPDLWKKSEIEEWLSLYAKLPVDMTPQNIAERVWQEKRPPSLIAHTLLRELDLIFTPKPKGD